MRDRQPLALSWQPRWVLALADGLRHQPFGLEAVEGDRLRGILVMAHVRSWLFGRFLVGLPYLNYGGVLADDDVTARALIDAAIALADKQRVRYLELRHEKPIEHPALVQRAHPKQHMRLPLPSSEKELWKALSAKVRNQVRKGQKSNLTVAWGKTDLLDEFYDVFSVNMRDLGTPVFAKRLFASILSQFPNESELAVVRTGGRPIASALLLHGRGISEAPSAASLRQYRPTCANMLLYWHLLMRSMERGQKVFDFGRSSPDSNTFKFKNQWGAEPEPAGWQYYLRQGTLDDMRPDNPKYRMFIGVWQRLPVWVTRLIGPGIVRGIP